MSKPLEYLDLELKHVQNKLTLDNMHYYCFAEGKGHKHRFHSEDQQLNLLCDTSYCILHNINACKKFSYDITDKFLSLSIKKNKKLEKLEKDINILNQKLDYLKQQQLSTELKKLPTTEDIQSLLTAINQETKKVEQETIKLVQALESKVHRLEELVQKLTTLIRRNMGE